MEPEAKQALLAGCRERFGPTRSARVCQYARKVLVPAYPAGETFWDTEDVWNLLGLASSMLELEEELKK